MAKYKRSLKNMIVDIRFQVKYTALVLLVSLAIFVVLAWMYQSEWEASNKLMTEINPIISKTAAKKPTPDDKGEMAEIDAILKDAGMDQEQQEVLHEFESEFEDEMSDRGLENMAVMIGSVGLLVILLAGLSIWLSHKAAGPIYAMRLFIRAARNGQWNRIRPLRKGDEFVYLSDEFMELVKEVRSRHEDELGELDQCSKALERGETKVAVDIIRRIREGKKSYLRGPKEKG